MTNSENLSISQTDGLPLFSNISADQIVPAVTKAINDNKTLIEDKLSSLTTFTWDNFVNALDEAEDHLSKLWSPISHMNAVVSNDELRQAHDACLPLFSEYSTFLGQNKALYEAYLSITEGDAFSGLNIEQQKVITNTLRDFKLAGIALSEEKQKRYGEITQKLSLLQSNFSNNVMDATSAWTKLITDVNELDGLPESAIAGAQQAAQEKNKQGYLLTLEFPSYLPVITYAKNRELRK